MFIAPQKLHSNHYHLFYMVLMKQRRSTISRVEQEKWKDHLLILSS